MLLSSEGTQILYAGVLLEIPLPWGIVLAPGFAPGVRVLKGERDLGAAVLFKSSVEMSFPIAPGLRGGAHFQPTPDSEPPLSHPNPGIETLLLGVQVDLQ